MAVAAPAAVDKKSVFRQALTALRYAVAATVMVVVVMTAVYAFLVSARTDDLDIDVIDDLISVYQTQGGAAKVSFTLSVGNPSGRVRFYYTNIGCVLNVSSAWSEFHIPDIVVAPDTAVKIDAAADPQIHSSTNNHRDDFQFLRRHPNLTVTGNLTLNGSLTVGVYSAYNWTSVAARYCCWFVTVGSVVNDSPTSSDADDDVPISVNGTSSSSSTPVPWCGTCLTNDKGMYSGETTVHL